jgi:transposase-like protein
MIQQQKRITALCEPIEGDWPYLWIDAIHVRVRQQGRIVSVAVIVVPVKAERPPTS